MAVVKIKPIKAAPALKNAVEYILDENKTDGKMLASSFGCSFETAYEEFCLTLSKAIEKGNNRAHHLIQSFEPGEATPEQAHEIGRRLADEVTKGRYEYVLTTHIDKGHIHNHIIFCAASFVDNRKYVSNKKSYYGIRNISDRLCREYGLSVVQPGQGRGKVRNNNESYVDRHGGDKWVSKSQTKAARELRLTIDSLIPLSSSFDDFLKRLESLGHKIKRGKLVSVCVPGQEGYIRTKTLGADYTEEALNKRIAGEYIPVMEKDNKIIQFVFDTPEEKSEGVDLHSVISSGSAKPDKPPYVRPAPAVNLIVDLENCVKAQQSAGFARWQKIQDLKEAAKTLNFLTENNLLQYAALESSAADVAAAFDETADALKAAEKWLKEMAALMKLISNYQQSKPVYDGLLMSKDKAAYRREHESAIILHEVATRALRKHADNSGRLPNPATLKAEYERLTEKKNTLRTEYGSLKRQMREYYAVKRNVDSILNPGTNRTMRKDRAAEL